MNDQEMQFADPEWRPPQQRGAGAVQGQGQEEESATPQPINATRIQAERSRDAGTIPSDGPPFQYREQTYSAPPPSLPPPQQEEEYKGPYSYTQSASPQFNSNQFRSRSPRPFTRSAWFWIIIIIILTSSSGFQFFIDRGFEVIASLMTIALLFFFFAFFFNKNRSSSGNVRAVETRTFSVGMHPAIGVRNSFGSVRVHTGGEGDQVIVQSSKQTRSWLGNPQRTEVFYDQGNEGKALNVRAASSGWSIFGWNRVDFDVTVPRDADLKLKTDAGSIHVNGVSGQMVLTSDAGTINVTQGILTGQSKLKTDVGVINFVGAIDVGGTYQFETDVGNVNVTLPAQASFHVDAKTDVGAFHSDFPIARQGNMTGSRASGDVGNPPYARLTLRSDVGSLNLRRGQ